MSRNYIFCHGCHSTAPENQANFADGEVTCPNCGSDFVEITDAPPVQEPVHVCAIITRGFRLPQHHHRAQGPPVLMPGAASWESLLGVSNGTTRIVRFGGNGGGGLTITMASGGAPPMGPLYGGPMGMPMGDLDLHAVLQHVRLVLEQSGYGCPLQVPCFNVPRPCECIPPPSSPILVFPGWPLATLWRAPTAKQ